MTNDAIPPRVWAMLRVLSHRGGSGRRRAPITAEALADLANVTVPVARDAINQAIMKKWGRMTDAGFQGRL